MKYKDLLVTVMPLALLTPKSGLTMCAAVSPTEQVEGADIIVQATAGSQTLVGRRSFRATQYLKGKNLGESFSLSDPITSATSVDVEWKNGASYVIFLRSILGKISTNECDGTTLWEERSDAVKTLEPGQAPQTQARTILIQLGALIFSVGAALWLLWIRGRHDPTRTG